MDGDGIARISEYGLEIVLSDEKSIPTNVRWMAPEVLESKGRRDPFGDDGKSADIYSFAMVTFEVRIPAFTAALELSLKISP